MGTERLKEIGPKGTALLGAFFAGTVALFSLFSLLSFLSDQLEQAAKSSAGAPDCHTRPLHGNNRLLSSGRC